MQDNHFNSIVKSISGERLRSYSNEYPAIANMATLERYVWNEMLCESFYCTLHFLEVGLRNGIDHALKGKYGVDWITDPTVFPMRSDECEARDSAMQSIQCRGSDVTADRIIGEVSFSFWTRLLSREYDQVWHAGSLKVAFPGLTGRSRKRSVPFDRLHKLRTFRNRVFHHNRIIHLPLATRHSEIIEAISWCNPSLPLLARALDSFPSVYGMGPKGMSRFLDRVGRPIPPAVT